MDDATLSSLRTALDASPGNLELRMVLVRAYLDRDRHDAACELLEDVDPAELESGEQRRAAASALLASGDPESGLVAIGDDDEPASLLIKARLLLELDRHREGLDAYRAAVSTAMRRPGRSRAFSRTTHTSHAPAEAAAPGVRCPALVVMGALDPDFADPAAEADWIAGALGDGTRTRVELVPEAGHYPHAQRPDVVNPVLTDFLASVTSRA